MVALLDLTPWYLVLISISIMLCLGWRSDAFIRRLSAASFPPAAGGTENMTPAHGVPPKHPPKKENPSRTLHSGTEIVIRSSFVFPQQIISPRGVGGAIWQTNLPLMWWFWTGHYSTGRTRVVLYGCHFLWNFPVAFFFFWRWQTDAPRFVLASGPDLTLKQWITEENEREGI